MKKIEPLDAGSLYKHLEATRSVGPVVFAIYDKVNELIEGYNEVMRNFFTNSLINGRSEIIITRVEVIDHTKDGEGRVFVKWQDDLKVKLLFQDDGRTLKVWLTDSEESGEKTLPCGCAEWWVRMSSYGNGHKFDCPLYRGESGE